MISTGDGSFSGKNVLCLGDLGWKEERKCDLRYFFHYEGAEFVHLGLRKPQYARERLISLAEAKRRFLAGQYEVVVAGQIPTPCINPRKTWVHRWAGFAGKALQLPGAWHAFRAERLLSLFAPRLVVIDLEDQLVIDNCRFNAGRHCRLYFKRELPQNPANAFLYTTDKNEDNGNIPRQRLFANWIDKMRPISIGVEPSIVAHGQAQIRRKTSDLFFIGRLACRTNRVTGMRQLEQLRAEGFRMNLPESKISRAEFLEHCASALTTWSPEGFGYDCTRTYEAAAMGSVPILQNPTIHRYARLEDGKHAIYYGVEADELYQKLRYWLARPEALIEMGLAAQDLVARRHGFDRLAHYIVETSKEALAERRVPSEAADLASGVTIA